MKIKMKYLIILTILVLTFLTRFFYFNHPAEVVFDEVYFGNFARAYFTHENYFDIHPPLGKLLIAGMAKIGGADIAKKDFGQIGQSYNARDLFILRFLPAIFSVLFVLLIYLIALRLTNLPIAAFVSSIMILFDNSIIAQSRIALLDIFLLFFGFLTIYLLLIQQEKTGKTKWLFIILSGISLGACYSIKWTGFSIIFMVCLLALYQLFKNRTLDKLGVKNWKEFFVKLFIIYIISFVFYAAIFSIHFSLLTKPGPGDAYMAQDFKNKPLAQKFYELNEKMFIYNKNINKEHPFQSKWYQWPINQKPVFYWQKTTAEQSPKQEIWLTGNLAVWLMASLSIIIGIIMILIKLIFKKPEDFSLFLPSFLITGWLANFLPFILIKRPLFMYSYFLALIFSIILFGYLSAYLLEKLQISKNKKRIILSLLVLIIIFFFVASANLTYGI